MLNISDETCDSQTSCWITDLFKTFCQKQDYSVKGVTWNFLVAEAQSDLDLKPNYTNFNLEFSVFSQGFWGQNVTRMSYSLH